MQTREDATSEIILFRENEPIDPSGYLGVFVVDKETPLSYIDEEGNSVTVESQLYSFGRSGQFDFIFPQERTLEQEAV